MGNVLARRVAWWLFALVFGTGGLVLAMVWVLSNGNECLLAAVFTALALALGAYQNAKGIANNG
jgi:hypothetical protein